jgi:galactokinase
MTEASMDGWEQNIPGANAELLRKWRFDARAFDAFRARVRSGELTPSSSLYRGRIEPPRDGDVPLLPSVDSSAARALYEAGLAALSRGAVAHVIVAGGMATRFRGPSGGPVVKGTVPVLGDKSFLELKIDDVRRAASLSSGDIPIVIMTSFATNDAIAEHLRERDLLDDDIELFGQSISLRLTPQGEIFGASSQLPQDAYTTPGHGDVFRALRDTGVLARLRENGVEIVMLSNVDNLGATIDPAIIGHFVKLRERGIAMLGETVEREPADGAKVGVVVRADGLLRVVEGFRIPDDVDQSALREASINTFYFDAAQIDRELPLQIHAVAKEVAGAKAIQGETITCEITGELDENGKPYLPFAAIRVKREGRVGHFYEGRFYPVKKPEDLPRVTELLASTIASASEDAHLKRVEVAFASTFGHEALNTARAFVSPGRINIIGEHTDYNDGFVLPAAVNRGIMALAAPSPGEEIEILSLDATARAKFSVSQTAPTTTEGWPRYAHAVIAALAERGVVARGMRVVLASDLPQGGGMSSSTALCLAIAKAATSINGMIVSDDDLSLIAQRAEHLMGVRCGIMDQWAIAHGRRGHAMLLDCKTLETTHVPLDLGAYVFLVSDTGKVRGLVDSEYNRRRMECSEAAQLLAEASKKQFTSLRDVSAEDLRMYGSALPNTLRKRAEHVIAENQRVLATVAALKESPPDLEKVGKLLDASHASLRDLFEVSCLELDLLVDLVRQQPGVLGARMMGGGFGGCTLSLVPRTFVDDIIRAIDAEYRRQTSLVPAYWAISPGDGLREIKR